MAVAMLAIACGLRRVQVRALGAFVAAPVEALQAEPRDQQGMAGRRGLLAGGLAGLAAAGDRLPAAQAKPSQQTAAAGRECRCCEIDWCITRCVSPTGTASCDCHAYLQAKGFTVPLTAPAALAAAGEAGWTEALGWQAAKVPRWRAVEGGLEVKDSKIEGAGQGLFAGEALPQWSVLPPYRGLELLPADLSRRRFTTEMDYVWCPRSAKALLNNQSSAELEAAAAQSPTYCVDSRATPERNPARYVNAARSEAQCKAVNIEICEFGQVAYFRTMEAVPAGTELVTDYGSNYWGDFEGC